MSPRHDFYLGLGSNIEPETNLATGIARLREHGEILEFSDVWESAAVGSDGPNFLNLCIRFEATPGADELKERVLLPIETALGRIRTGDKNAPRTLDIDILAVDGRPIQPERWDYPFVVVPLAELIPNFIHPLKDETLKEASVRAQADTWIVRRPGILATIKAPTQSQS